MGYMRSRVIVMMVIFLAIIVSGFYFYTNYINESVTLDKLYDQLDPNTQWYKQYQTESGIRGLESFSYKQEGNDIELHAGNYYIKTTVAELLEPETVKNMKRIGITMKYNKKTKHLTLYYRGERIKEYVN